MVSLCFMKAGHIPLLLSSFFNCLIVNLGDIFKEVLEEVLNFKYFCNFNPLRSRLDVSLDQCLK